MTNREWFPQAKYGMMIHMGLYSLLAGEWKGRRTPGNAEWLQNYLEIPNRDYVPLAKIVNPIFFNAEECHHRQGGGHGIYGGHQQAPRGLCPGQIRIR